MPLPFAAGKTAERMTYCFRRLPLAAEVHGALALFPENRSKFGKAGVFTVSVQKSKIFHSQVRSGITVWETT